MDDPGSDRTATGTRSIPEAPLYDARFEHDACGVGFVAESRRGPSERVVPLALAALAAMAHRGATAADARTSDGSGLAMPLSRGAAPSGSRRGSRRHPADPVGLQSGIGLPARRGRGRGARRSAWSSASLAAERLAVARLADRPDRAGRPRRSGRGIAAGDPPGCRRPVRPRCRRQPSSSACSTPGGRSNATAARDSRPRDRSTCPRCPAGRSSTRAWSGAPTWAASTPTWPTRRRRSPTRPSTSASRRTPGRPGGSPSRSATWPTTARSTRSGATARRWPAGRRGWAADRSGGDWPGPRRPARRSSTRTAPIRPSLDEALELLVMAGWSLPAAMIALVPEAPALRDAPVAGLEAWQRVDRRPARAVGRPGGPRLQRRPAGRRACSTGTGCVRPPGRSGRDGLVILASEAGLLPAPARARSSAAAAWVRARSSSSSRRRARIARGSGRQGRRRSPRWPARAGVRADRPVGGRRRRRCRPRAVEPRPSTRKRNRPAAAGSPSGSTPSSCG